MRLVTLLLCWTFHALLSLLLGTEHDDHHLLAQLFLLGCLVLQLLVLLHLLVEQ